MKRELIALLDMVNQNIRNVSGELTNYMVTTILTPEETLKVLTLLRALDETASLAEATKSEANE